MEKVTLTVRGMSCQHCVNSIEWSVGRLAGVKQVKVNLLEANVEVAFDSDEVKLGQIKESIESQGYVVCH